MADKKKEKDIPEIYFQTFYVKIWNPITETEEERVFTGKAMFTPEEVEKLKDRPIEELILDAHFTPPENPYLNPENTEAYDYMLKHIRRIANDESGYGSESDKKQ